MGKGSGRRPGEGYADGWAAIFGKKEVECRHDWVEVALCETGAALFRCSKCGSEDLVPPQGGQRRHAILAGQFKAVRVTESYRYPSKTEIDADINNETLAITVAVAAMADAIEACPLKDSLKVYAAIELAFKYGNDLRYVEEVFMEYMLRAKGVL